MEDMGGILLHAIACSLLVLGIVAVWFGIIAVVKLTLIVWAL
jgi:hypothetical protein